MKLRNLARSLLRFLAALAVLAIVAVLDWYPTFKDLGRLRRERSDMERKAKGHVVMASRFVFPDAVEKSLFEQGHAHLRRLLPVMKDDAAWLSWTTSWLRRQAEAAKITWALLLSSPDPGRAMDSEERLIGQASATDLLTTVWRQDIQKKFRDIADPNQYRWHYVFSGMKFDPKQVLSSRPLAIALTAPLPALLAFINQCSWGEARLEIVRLRLVSGPAFSLAWLFLRGDYLLHRPSSWLVNDTVGSENSLLVDPDSPLLWQKVTGEK
jgi:hypothetical protein